MHQCEICNHQGDDFEEITEEEISQAVSDGIIDHPDDLADALANLGFQCPSCGSMHTVEIEVD